MLSAFLNESSFNTSVLSRQGSKSTFPSGVKIFHADYDSVSSLKDAFQGQDAVVSLVASAALGAQDKLIDAAIEAGVNRFIPSEFGSNTPDKRTRKIVPVFETKFSIVNYLKSKEHDISWTSVITGAFFDMSLRDGFLGFHRSTKTATIYDDGKAVFSTTNLHQVGITLIRSLEKAELTKNQFVYVNSFQTSQKEILALIERVTGEKWTVNHQTTAKLLEDGRARFQKGDFSAIPDLIRVAIFDPSENLGDSSPEGLWNDKLNLPKEDIEATARTELGA